MKNKLKNIAFATALFLAANFANAQVKIGDNPTSINASSVLEMESTNKGMLLPRVGLTNTTAFAPLTAHIAGMTVYNTATVGDVTPGTYYNDGTKWVRFQGGATTNTIAATGSNITTNVNGVAATYTPPAGLLAPNSTLGFNSAGVLVKGLEPAFTPILTNGTDVGVHGGDITSTNVIYYTVTVPVGGLYTITACPALYNATSNKTASARYVINRNGVAISQQYYVSPTPTINGFTLTSATITATINLSAGDVITVIGQITYGDDTTLKHHINGTLALLQIN